jgi:translation initiation factor 2 subunit 1
MVLSKESFPELGELVIARVTSIQPGYVEVELEDYRGLEHEGHAHGMVSISELSNRWVKNIHSIITVGQRVVLLVLRIDKERGYVDLSLRRVTKEQKSSKMNAWRYATKAENLLKFFAEQHGMSLEDLHIKAIFPLIEKFGELRAAMEAIKEDGVATVEEIKEFTLDEPIRSAFISFVSDNVTIHKVEVFAEFKIRSNEGNGIMLIKQALIEAKNMKAPKGLELKIYYVGSPYYRVEIEAFEYIEAEKQLEKIKEHVETIIGKKGTVELIRDFLSNEQKSSATA